MWYRVRAQKHSTFVRSNSTYFLILNISYSLYNFKRSQLWMIQLLVHWTIFRSFCTWIIIKYMHYFCCLKSADTSTTVMQPNEYYHQILVAGFGKSIVFATIFPFVFSLHLNQNIVVLFVWLDLRFIKVLHGNSLNSQINSQINWQTWKYLSRQCRSYANHLHCSLFVKIDYNSIGSLCAIPNLSNTADCKYARALTWLYNVIVNKRNQHQQ